jgi:hypothetical protein
MKTHSELNLKIETDAKAIAERDTRIAQMQEAVDCIPEYEAKRESDAKVIAALREALDRSAMTFGLLAFAAKGEGMDGLSKIATECAHEAEAALAETIEQLTRDPK